MCSSDLDRRIVETFQRRVAVLVLDLCGFSRLGEDAACKGDIVLDPRHGGTDTGAVNKTYNLKESQEVLKVATLLKGLLEADGHTVCMTRTTNSETLYNNDRYTYVNTTGQRS